MNEEMVAPPPGNTPIRNPINEPRAMGAAAARHSSQRPRSPRIFVLSTSGLTLRSILTSASPMPKRPMATMTNSKPSDSLKNP
jgi:hypothetical protein